ncbi:hypothetical protein SDRG_13616 [Saprolegnia diclina VS20]|uniref:Guanylate-binding protein N-terminal domain-containing protein n=1 Tax=Saprolegnia diclina (strain VS20) TaxID=1156394 RepID=T0R8W3_SAPDV|nr:hypothetical protein SDRG_13616 [Saprolegnia diclina VS20]EQC28538.1 hypothetical protein SDRG_13616 [Saprolegnia diclina VS20]|eukprot:XP_008617935.1 hypothetical protein SDRG_13616 [Saprolegnia diclina VS20]
MQVLVWKHADERLEVDDGAMDVYLAHAAAGRVRVVGLMNGDAPADATFAATKEHQLLLHTMAPSLPTLDAGDDEKQPLLWMHAEEASNVVVLASKNEHLGRLLLVLLSSVLLYSQDSELSFDKLRWIADLPTLFKLRSNQDEAGVMKDLASVLPRFVWVARNSKVKWLANPGSATKKTPMEYFDGLFALESGFSEGVMQSNAFKTYFTTFFPTRDCMMISRAVEANAGIELAYDLSRDVLRSDYVAAADKVHSRYLSGDAGEDTVPAKHVAGNAITPAQFRILVEYFVESLNTNQLPILQHAATKMLRVTCEQGIARATEQYTRTFASLVPLAAEDSATIPSSRLLLLAHLQSLRAASVEVYTLSQQIPVTNAAAQTLLQDQIATLHAALDAAYAEARASALELSQEACTTLLATLHPLSLTETTAELAQRPRDEFPDGLQATLLGFKSNLQRALAEYKAGATARNHQGSSNSAYDPEAGLGVAMYPSLQVYLSDHILGSVVEWGKQVLGLFEKHMATANEEKVALEQELAELTAADALTDTSDRRKEFERELSARTDELSSLKSTLTAELEDKRMDLERLLLDLQGVTSKHEARVASTEREIERIKAKTLKIEEQALLERQKRETLVHGAAMDILNIETSLHSQQKSLYSEQRSALAKVAELERSLNTKKTAHLQSLFDLETGCARQMEDTKAAHKKDMADLKTQAKQDIFMLKKAYDSKKSVVQHQLDEVNVLVKQCEDQLALLEPKLNLDGPVPRLNTAQGNPRSTQDEMCKQS